jgi:hypothetical protein
MLTKARIEATFPEISEIRDKRLRQLVGNVWEFVGSRNPIHADPERIPLHPTLPPERHGYLASHLHAMAQVAERLVPTYERVWSIALDLDAFRTAVYIHDAAKVIEFVERDGQLVATPGYNHAIEGGGIARLLGAPESVAHMVEAHSFTGPLVMPRTREAQLFLFLDVICLPAFPEHGDGAVERHLRANGWTAPKLP